MAKNWAVCIGINHYVNMPDLRCAKRDAEKMRDWFKAAGFKTVYLFTDDSPEIDDSSQPYDSRPTGNILKRFFRIRFKPDTFTVEDNLWFFFSGHGLRHEGKDYLMPSDGDPHPEGVEETAIPLSYVTERLRGCGAGDVVIIYDACRNEASAKGLGFGQEEQKGVITLASCSPNERSYEIDVPEIQQGSFTYALIEALENTQSGQGNYATFDRLYQQLRYRVPEINRHYDKPENQHPYGFVQPDEKRYSILLPKQATDPDIETYKKQALNAEINNNLHEAERLLIRLWEIRPGDPEIRQYYNRVILKKATPPTLPPFPSTQPSSPSESSLPQTVEFEVVTVNAKGEQIQKESKQAQYFTQELGNGITLDMIAIPGGKFPMGAAKNEKGASSDEYPQHEVTVPPFFMGKYPITQAQWRAIASRTDLKVERDLKRNPSYFKGDNRPVERVSWDDAVEFCARLSKLRGREYRLPSEAEWEYACRAGTSTAFYFGETITTDLANYQGIDWEYEGKVYPGSYGEGPKGQYRRETTSVGQFPPNAFGLYDMHGQVWEWCADIWHENYEGAPSDGSAWLGGNNNDYQVLRGGSWFNVPPNCRSASRLRNWRAFISHYWGFRVVCVSGRTL